VNRTITLILALVFIAGFGILTAATISSQGLTVAGVIAILILVLLTVGILGALRHPPD
jgi:hypothetical protein